MLYCVPNDRAAHYISPLFIPLFPPTLPSLAPIFIPTISPPLSLIYPYPFVNICKQLFQKRQF